MKYGTFLLRRLFITFLNPSSVPPGAMTVKTAHKRRAYHGSDKKIDQTRTERIAESDPHIHIYDYR